MPAVRAIVTGHVQGVFFRASAKEKAEQLHLTGWVRNLPDGSVEVHAEGHSTKLTALEQWLHEGPPHAQVKTVHVAEAEEKGYATFEVT